MPLSRSFSFPLPHFRSRNRILSESKQLSRRAAPPTLTRFTVGDKVTPLCMRKEVTTGLGRGRKVKHPAIQAGQ